LSTIKPKDIREARAFLQKRNLKTSDIAPKTFAQLANRYNKSFYDTLKLLAVLKMGGQGQSPFAQTESAIAKERK
jgi:hypothetical protein